MSATHATRFHMRVTGILPMHETAFELRTIPTLLNRREFPRARNQLNEALGAAMRIRPAELTLAIWRGEEQLRAVRLMEDPDREGYLVAEVKPGEDMGTVEQWILHCAVAFSPRGAMAQAC